MKTSKILLTTLLGLLISFSNAFSQRKKFPDVVYIPTTGYVIDIKNDTIQCELRTDEFSHSYKYRVNKTDGFIKIDSNITEYFIASDSSNYIRKSIPESNYYRYVKRLEKGKINLYEDHSTFYNQTTFSSQYTTETTWYVSKGNGDLIKIKHSSFSVTGFTHPQKKEKKAFLDLIADAPDIAEEFKQADRYNFDIIREYIKRYNLSYLTNNKSGK